MCGNRLYRINRKVMKCVNIFKQHKPNARFARDWNGIFYGVATSLSYAYGSYDIAKK